MNSYIHATGCLCYCSLRNFIKDPKVLIKDGRGKITLPPLSVSIITLNEEATTSLHNVSLATAISVYPNPSANGIFYLNRMEYWEVYNSLGKKIISGKSPQVDLSGFNKGLYLLKTSKGISKLLSK